jgi:hypothetical protein
MKKTKIFYVGTLYSGLKRVVGVEDDPGLIEARLYGLGIESGRMRKEQQSVPVVKVKEHQVKAIGQLDVGQVVDNFLS